MRVYAYVHTCTSVSLIKTRQEPFKPNPSSLVPKSGLALRVSGRWATLRERGGGQLTSASDFDVFSSFLLQYFGIRPRCMNSIEDDSEIHKRLRCVSLTNDDSELFTRNSMLFTRCSENFTKKKTKKKNSSLHTQKRSMQIGRSPRIFRDTVIQRDKAGTALTNLCNQPTDHMQTIVPTQTSVQTGRIRGTCDIFRSHFARCTLHTVCMYVEPRTFHLGIRMEPLSCTTAKGCTHSTCLVSERI